MERYHLIILPHPETAEEYWNKEPHVPFRTILELYDFVTFSDFYGRPWKVIDSLKAREYTSKEIVEMCIRLRK